MKKPALLLSTLLLPLALAFNTAQARPSGWYQIEMIIFAHPANTSTTELWRDHFAADYANNPIILGTTDHPATTWDSAANITLSDNAFQTLPAAERKLNNAAKRIKNSADLRFLSHLAWRQPLPRDQQSQPILIQAGQQFNDEFELQGTISIRRNRYLHTQTELFFSRFEQMKSVQALDWTVFSGDNLEFGQREWNSSLNTPTGPQYVRATTAKLTQSRRMRSDELHYIDHPLFGILMHISRYQLPDPAMDLKPISSQNLPTIRPLPDSAISPNL